MTLAAPPDYLTVKELAELLRIKERKVYDLAASGTLPCSRATGKLLFPRSEIDQWLEGATTRPERQAVDRPKLVLGSHDPLLDWAVRSSQSGLATYYDGSQDGLDRFAKGEGMAAGLHIFDAETKTWNVPSVTDMAGADGAVLVRFARRQRGIVSRKDGMDIKSLNDLRGLKVCPRQAESGTAKVLSSLLTADGIQQSELTLTDVARTEDDAVRMVRYGEADATFGLASVAAAYDLAFLPVIEEAFDLLIDRKSWFDPPLQTLLDFCRSDSFVQHARSHVGYDLSEFGKVIWNS